MKTTLTAILLLTGSIAYSQDLSGKELFNKLQVMDSLLFEYAFKQCDTTSLRPMLAEDFEFYHDQSGITDGRDSFVNGVPNICSLSYKPIRKLLPETLKVFPMYENGKLYGAIQTGIHEFYAKDGNLPVYLTSTAKFTHLWLLDNGNWVLKRVLSYDHVVPR